MGLWRPGKTGLMPEARGRAVELDGFEAGLQQAPSNTDNDLVRDFIAGNDAAFTQLVTKYKDGLTNYLNVMVADYDIAVDLSQETFLRVYKNIGKYSHIYQFSTWLYRIATNLAIDEMRYRKRRGQVFYRNVWGARQGNESDAPEFELRDRRRGPGDEVLRKESWPSARRRHPVTAGEIPDGFYHERDTGVALRGDRKDPELARKAPSSPGSTVRVNCCSGSCSITCRRHLLGYCVYGLPEVSSQPGRLPAGGARLRGSLRHGTSCAAVLRLRQGCGRRPEAGPDGAGVGQGEGPTELRSGRTDQNPGTQGHAQTLLDALDLPLGLVFLALGRCRHLGCRRRSAGRPPDAMDALPEPARFSRFGRRLWPRSPSVAGRESTTRPSRCGRPRRGKPTARSRSPSPGSPPSWGRTRRSRSMRNPEMRVLSSTWYPGRGIVL